MAIKSIKSATQSVWKDTKQAWKHETNIIKKSGKDAYKDTVGLGVPVGIGVAVHESKGKGAALGKTLLKAGKSTGVGLAVEMSIRFTGNMIKNQLAFNHSYK